MTTSYKLMASLAAAAVASLFALPCNAAESNGSAISKTVKTWDLDFAKSADVQTFNARVRDAAHQVCAAEAHRYWQTTRRAAPMAWRDQCVADAVDAAVRDVGNRRLAMDTSRVSR
jgi:UrcA family protein